MITAVVKFIINAFANMIRGSKPSLKYLYTKALKNETVNFIDYGYGETAPHIEKTIQLAKKFKVDKNTVLDIGAANGTTPLKYKKGLEHASVFMFEPLPENFERLQKIASENEGITLIRKAAGNESGKVKINRTERITSSSIFEITDEVDGDYLKKALSNKTEIEIEITRIDDEIKSGEKISIMKLDVQGYELEVLKGAVRTLSNTAIVVAEMSNHHNYKGAPLYYKIDEFLRNNNFSLYDNCLSFKEDCKLMEWDGIYVHNSLMK